MDTSKIKKDALFILDGSYFLYRSYFALPALHNSAGHPTNATYAFCRTLNKLIKDFDPQQLVVVWDSPGGSTTRKELLPAYKGTRPEPPADLFIQKDDIIEIIKTIDIANIAKPGLEGDDLICSLAKTNPDTQVIIVCADKDMYQLLTLPHVIIMDPFKGRIIDASIFEQDNGFSPSKIPFYYSILGDKSDNIPGVAGIGQKGALDLVQQFDSLDDLYKNIDKIEKKRHRTLLTENKDNALLSFKLFLLTYDHFTMKKDEARFDKNKWSNALPLFQKFEFKSLVKEIGQHKTVPTQMHQVSIFSTDIQEVKSSWKNTIVTTHDQLDAMITHLKKKKFFAIDTETTGVLPFHDRLVGISFASDEQEAFYIPLRHHNDIEYQQLPLDECLTKLKPLLESIIIKKTLHHAKFDYLVLWNAGIDLQGICFDSLIAASLIKKPTQKIGLKSLSELYLDEPMESFKTIMGKNYKNFSDVPIKAASHYAAHDALQTLKLKPLIEGDLHKEPVFRKLYETIEMPLCNVLIAMEKKGILVDPEIIKKLLYIVNRKVAIIEEKIYAALEIYKDVPKTKINLNSPKQIESLLFDQLKLPMQKKNKKGSRSTDHDVLQKLSLQHPIPALILTHRELAKLKNTYLEPLPRAIAPQTGRIHTTFNQVNVATGRLASSDPNLQNIPASSGYGSQIRSAFIAPPDSLLLSADYSQIELRVLAHLTQDKYLKQAFIQKKDIHAQTAAQLFDVTIDKVTHEQRQLGKKINFSIIYGKTPFGLAQELNIKPNEAKAYIESYFSQYPQVAIWMHDTMTGALENGYVETWQGRRRYIPEIYERNHTKQELGKRIAINTVVQGTAADIMKIAMIRIHKALQEKNFDTHLILQIHDELLLETPKKYLSLAQEIVLKEMEGVVDWDTPLEITMKSGADWGAITK